VWARGAVKQGAPAQRTGTDLVCEAIEDGAFLDLCRFENIALHDGPRARRTCAVVSDGHQTVRVMPKSAGRKAGHTESDSERRPWLDESIRFLATPCKSHCPPVCSDAVPIRRYAPEDSDKFGCLVVSDPLFRANSKSKTRPLLGCRRPWLRVMSSARRVIRSQRLPFRIATLLVKSGSLGDARTCRTHSATPAQHP
jgi:hypothetical protein